MTNEITGDMFQWVIKQVDVIDTEIGNTSKNSNGDAYVTLCCGGVRKEGEKLPVLCSTTELVVDFWKKSFLEYVETLNIKGSKKLWWRNHPTLEEVNVNGEEYFQIHSRLVVTNV